MEEEHGAFFPLTCQEERLGPSASSFYVEILTNRNVFAGEVVNDHAEE